MSLRIICLFCRHDIAVSSVDPATKAVMEACIAENEADKHASNLKVSLTICIITLLLQLTNFALLIITYLLKTYFR